MPSLKNVNVKAAGEFGSLLDVMERRGTEAGTASASQERADTSGGGREKLERINLIISTHAGYPPALIERVLVSEARLDPETAEMYEEHLGARK